MEAALISVAGAVILLLFGWIKKDIHDILKRLRDLEFEIYIDRYGHGFSSDGRHPDGHVLPTGTGKTRNNRYELVPKSEKK